VRRSPASLPSEFDTLTAGRPLPVGLGDVKDGDGDGRLAADGATGGRGGLGDLVPSRNEEADASSPIVVAANSPENCE
jgi:hypothetical protein